MKTKSFVKLILTIIFLFTNSLLFSSKPNNISGKLIVNKSFEYQINGFKISTNKDSKTFIISNNNLEFKAIGKSFINAAIGEENVTDAKGSFFIKDNLLEIFKNQTIDETIFFENQDSLVISGKLISKNEEVNYTFSIKISEANTLKFSIKTSSDKVNRLFLKFNSSKNEQYYGLGEQFTHLQLNGFYVPCFISEQGIGRGKQPITTLVNLAAKSGGTEFTTYSAIPFFFSSKKYSISLNNTEYSAFDFRKKDSWQIRCYTNKLEGQIFVAKDYKTIISENAKHQGLMREMPDWFHKGAIIGIQGGTEKVASIYDSLMKYNAAVSGLWLQDWVGQRITSFGKQLWWNWQLDKKHYPYWPNLSKKITNDSVPILVYLNPFLVDVKDNPNHPQNLFQIAKENDYLVKNPKGEVYLIPNTDFSAGILDLTNPKAKQWFKKVVYDNVISINAKGWMADFGEALPYDAMLYSGESGASFHNKYPVEWEKLNREIIDSLPNGDEYVFFSRAGFSGSSNYATMFWEGDQLVSWDKYDGIKSAVIGLLSSGLSGMTLNHSDIGGYTGITNPLAKNIRSKELLWRWIELNAFSPVFRTHEGNIPDDHYQFYEDKETLKHFAKYSNIFASLFDYRKMLMKKACKTGIPMILPMFYLYENDKICKEISYEQYMYGTDFLVAPILDKGKKTKKVYLPAGKWIYLWTGEEFTSNGKYIKVKADLGEIPVFYVKNSKYGEDLRKFVSTLK